MNKNNIVKKEKTYYQEYEINDRNVTKLDLINQDFVHIHSDAIVSHNSLSIPLYHVYESQNKNENQYMIGKGWRSNLHQYLIKDNYNTNTQSREISYIDKEGNKHTFEEKWYYEDNGGKHYVDKTQVYLDYDQKFKCLLENNEIVEVNCDIKNKDKLTLVIGSNFSLKNLVKHKKKKYFIQLKNAKIEVEQDADGYLLVPHFCIVDNVRINDNDPYKVKIDSFNAAQALGFAEFKNENSLKKNEIEETIFPASQYYEYYNYDGLVLNENNVIMGEHGGIIKRIDYIKNKIYEKDGMYYTKWLKGLYRWAEVSFYRRDFFCNQNYEEDYIYVPLIVEESIEFVNNNEDIGIYENDDVKQIEQTIKNYEDMMLSLKENIKSQYLSLRNMSYQHASSLLSASEYFKNNENHLSDGRYAYKKINDESVKISNETIDFLYQSILANEKTLEKYELEVQNLKEQKEYLIEEQRKQVNDFIIDENGNTLGFDGYGRLILIQDREENKIQIEYGYEKENEGKILAVYSETEMIRFDYNKVTGLLDSIVDPQGRKTKYQYVSNGCIESITYNDQTKTIFEYQKTSYAFKVTSPMLESLEISSYDNEYEIRGYCFDGEITADTKLDEEDETKNTFIHSYLFNETNVTLNDLLLEEETKYTFDTTGKILQRSSNKEMITYNYDGDHLIDEIHYDLLKTENILSSNTIYPDSPYFGCQLYNKQLKCKWLAAKVSVDESLVKDFTDYTLSLKVKIRLTDIIEKTVEMAFSNTKELFLPFSIDYPTIQDVMVELGIVQSIGNCNPVALGKFSILKSEEEMQYKYDEKDRLIQSKTLDQTINYYDYDEDDLYHHVKTIDKYGEEVHTYFSYDVNKQLTLVEDSKGNVEEYTYDEKGNCIEKRKFNKKDASLIRIETPKEDSNEEKVFTQYDKNTGDLLSVSSSSKGIHNATSFTYNYGLLTSMMHHGMKVEYTYDGQGRKKSVSLNGVTYVTTTYVDDCDKRSNESETDLKHASNVSSTYKNGYKVENVYDNEKRLRRQILNNETNIAYDYDQSNRLIKTTYSDSTPNETITYNDDKIQKITKGTFTQSYTYDEKDRVKSIIEKVGNIEITNQKYNYLDHLNCFTIITNYGNTCFDYDALNRIVHHEFDSENLKVCHEYSYLHKEGNTLDLIAQDFVKIITMDENDQPILSTQTNNYEYDEQGNIITIDSDDRLTRYQYDTLNRLVREDNPSLNQTIVYKYDAGGNILLKKKYEYSLEDKLVSPTVDEYAYPCNGWKDQLISFNGKTIAYDNMGRPTTYKDVNMTWNKNGTLASIGNHITYTYNANGIRTKKVVNGVATSFLVDGTRIVKATAPNVELIYRYVLNKLIGFCYNGIEYIYERNILGDIVRIFNSETGEIVGEYAYDGYGNHCIIKDVEGIATLNPFRYRGYYFDSETNLFFLNSRYYDPETGRFISPDIISILDETKGQINGLNLYMYCGNNPIMNVDPSGYAWEWSTFWTGIGMVLTAVSAIALSIATFGTATPLAMTIIAGVTAFSGVLTGINGIATIIEAGTQYNFVRDGIFNGIGWSDSAYNIYAGVIMGIAELGSMILGIYRITPSGKRVMADNEMQRIINNPQRIQKYNTKKFGELAQKSSWDYIDAKNGKGMRAILNDKSIRFNMNGTRFDEAHFYGHSYWVVSSGTLRKLKFIYLF